MKRHSARTRPLLAVVETLKVVCWFVQMDTVARDRELSLCLRTMTAGAQLKTMRGTEQAQVLFGIPRVNTMNVVEQQEY
jgi:hypothetical protein